MSDLISIIVPIYNVEKYVNKCVGSIVNQTYTNLEIILVDDGSLDRCPEICDEWTKKDSRIKVIHKKNGGLSDARNAGMEIASGDYIAFVDSDDWIEKDFIKILYDSLTANNVEISACDVRFVYENGEQKDTHKPTGESFICSPEQSFSFVIQQRGFRAVAWNKLYKSKLLNNERFEVGRYHEDEFFTHRIIAKASKLVYTDNALYNYLQRSGSITSNFSVKRVTDVLDAYIQRLAFMGKKYPNVYKQQKLDFCIACANLICDAIENSSKEAIRIIKQKRKSLKFTVREIFSYDTHGIIYIVGTKYFPYIIAMYLKLRRRDER